MIFNAVRKHSLCLMTFRIRPVMSATYHSTRIALSQNSPKKSKLSFSLDKPSEEFLEKKSKTIFDNFTSQEGKTNFSVGLLVTSVVSLTLLLAAPYTFYRKKLTEYHEHPETRFVKKPPKTRREKFEAELQELNFYVSDYGRNLAEQVMNDLKFSDKEKGKIKLFIADYFEALSYGSVQMRIHTHFGLPHFIHYTSSDQVDPESVRFSPVFSLLKNELSLSEIKPSNKEEEDEFEKLKQTFVLSENAKKFLIAQKLIPARSVAIMLMDIVFMPCLLFISGLITAELNERHKMFKKPFFLRLALYATVYSSWLLMSVIGFSSNQGECDDFVDRQAYALGSDYLEGAEEFYAKAIERGKLFHKLHPRGKFYFTENGETIKYFFQPPSVESSTFKSRLEKAKTYLESGDPIIFGQGFMDRLRLAGNAQKPWFSLNK